MTGQVLEHEAEGLVVLTLSNPSLRNALDNAMIEQLIALLTRHRSSDTCRAVVIKGEGKIFCGGRALNELEMLQDRPVAEVRGAYDRLRQVSELIAACPFPVIAAINGYALGGGAMLACWCDITLIEKDAFLAYPETQLGIAGQLAIVHLARLVPPSVASDLLYTGRRINGEDAARMGLLSRCVSRADFDAELATILQGIFRAAPSAIAISKQFLRESSKQPVVEALASAVEGLGSSVTSGDALEGVAAFSEKRKPRWRIEPPAI
jgi:enoyl-CoA hydratase/carnithine racemase